MSVTIHRRYGLVLALAVASCAPSFDPSRTPTPVGTLGEEVFGVVCERVHHGESPTDLSFARGRGPCTRGLGPGDVADVGPRTLALARRRGEIANALDRAMPPSLEAPLDALLIDLLPLYGPDGSNRRGLVAGTRRWLIDDRDGAVVPSEPVLPETTRALVATLDTVRTEVAFLRALGRASLRAGTRPPAVALGLARPLLTYDRLDPTLDALLRLVREAGPTQPRGSAHPQFRTALEVLRGEMATASPSTETRGGTTLDATLDLALRTDTAFARGTRIEVVRRDLRGVASVDLGNPEAAALFADANGDGAADVDREGYYLGRAGRIADAPTPYPVFGRVAVPRDARGRAVTANGRPLYRHLDLDATALAGLARELPALLGAPQHREAPALRLLRGAAPLLGTRREATQAYTSANLVRYRQFSADEAPLVDLAHAAGLLLGHGDADVILRLLSALVAPEREGLTARLLGVLRQIDEISDRHPEATMAPEAVLWDEVIEVARRIAQEPGLLEDILGAVAQLQRPLGANSLWDARCAGTIPAENLARAFGAYARHRDRVQPDWSGDWNRRVTGGLSVAVDRTRPDTVDLSAPGGVRDNRSVLQRLFHLIDDLNGARMCNKPGAAVRVRVNVPLLGERAITVPGAGNLEQCRLVEVPDAAAFFARSIVGDGRAVLPMELPGVAGSLADIARQLGLPVDSTLDRIVEAQSGIEGFNSQPSPFAIARLVFHPRPNAFLGDLMDPPPIRNVLPGPGALPPSPTPRGRAVRELHPGTLFVWEGYCFYDSMRPLLGAFARHDRHADGSRDPRWTPGRSLASMSPRNLDLSRGTQLFAQLIGAFHRHWATTAATEYQSREACPSCTAGMNFSRQSGASRYEPIFAESLEAGVLATLGAVTAELATVDLGGGRTGIDALASLLRALVDPEARALDGAPAFTTPLADRQGRRTTRWSDGTTPVPQTTPYHLFADAFNAMDPLLARDETARGHWVAARSAMVDQFLTVEGAGSSARLRNRNLAPLARTLVAWLRDRIAAHRVAGDLDAWSRSFGARLAATVRGAPFAAMTDLLLALDDDATARTEALAMIRHLVDETTAAQGDTTNFSATVTAIAELLQVLRADDEVDPIVRPLAPVFTPTTGLAAQGLRLLDEARLRDPRRTLTQLLGNLVRRPAGGDALAREPLVVLADAFTDIERERPGQRGPLSAMDVHLALTSLREFLADPARGLEQFYAIVQQRRLP